MKNRKSHKNIQSKTNFVQFFFNYKKYEKPIFLFSFYKITGIIKHKTLSIITRGALFLTAQQNTESK